MAPVGNRNTRGSRGGGEGRPGRLVRFARTRVVAAALLLIFVQASAAAAPNEPLHGDVAAAQVLFDAGRKLMKEGRYAEACVQLEESQRLDAGWGTLINLADCTEHLGRTATAWSLFLEVAAGARQAGQRERADNARMRATALESRLSRIVIALESHVPPDLEVKRDGVFVGRAQWGVAVPVDPGDHVIEAKASGRLTWTHVAHVGVAPTEIRVDIPPLVEAPIVNAPALPQAHGAHHTATLVSGAAGLVALSLAGFFAARAIEHNRQSMGSCQGDLCGPPGYSLRQQALTDGRRATYASAIGVSALVTAAAFYLIGRPRDSVGLVAGGALMQTGGRF